MGLLGPNDRVELIEGDIVQKMPQSSPHSTALMAGLDALRLAFPVGFVVRPQLPLSIGDLSQPEPDLVVVAGSARDYSRAQPEAAAAVLVVEISDSTLLPDQTTKAALCARAGVRDYRIVNVPERSLEVYRKPLPMDDALLGHGYQDLVRLAESETIAPLAAPGFPVAVADLLP